MFNFVQPWMLWGLLAAGIPLLIHLINRWRHKSIPWAAMSFLIKATREIKGSKKIRHYLILAARMLAVAALAVALSRPRTSSWLGSGAHEAENVIMILDRSASMEIKATGEVLSLREKAIDHLSATMANMDKVRFFLLESAGGRIIEISSPEVLPDLIETSATDTAADIPALLERALNYMDNNLQGNTEIWIASDMQSSNWMPESGRWQVLKEFFESHAEKMSVRVLSMLDGDSINRSVRINRLQLRHNELELEIEIRQKGSFISRDAVDLPLTIAINGGNWAETMSVSGEFSFADKIISLPENLESGYGYIAIQHDNNTRDNVAFFTFARSASASRVLVVGQPDDTSELLKNMAAPAGLTEVAGERISSSQWNLIDPQHYSLIIWDASLPDQDDAVKLRQYVEGGGLVLFIPDVNEEGNREFMGLKWGNRQEAREDTLFLIPQWDREKGILRDASDGHPIPVEQVRAIIKQQILGEGVAVALWDDGSPVLVSRKSGEGEFVFLGTRPDYEWSNLPDGFMLLPLLQRMANEGLSRFSMSHTHEIGIWKLPVREGQILERVDGYDNAGTAFRDYQAGVYRIDNDFYALNRPETEDVFEELSMDTARNLFPGVFYNSFEGTSSGARTALVREIWRVFYIFLVLVLILEALLCLPHLFKYKLVFRTR